MCFCVLSSFVIHFDHRDRCCSMCALFYCSFEVFLWHLYKQAHHPAQTTIKTIIMIWQSPGKPFGPSLSLLFPSTLNFNDVDVSCVFQELKMNGNVFMSGSFTDYCLAFVWFHSKKPGKLENTQILNWYFYHVHQKWYRYLFQSAH